MLSLRLSLSPVSLMLVFFGGVPPCFVVLCITHLEVLAVTVPTSWEVLRGANEQIALRHSRKIGEWSQSNGKEKEFLVWIWMVSVSPLFKNSYNHN